MSATLENVHMAGCQRFAKRGDPSKDGNCHSCGQRLRPPKPGLRIYMGQHRGAYGDDAFCSIRCGYAFGVRMAELGERLRLKTK
jgi:hypothetical protein